MMTENRVDLFSKPFDDAGTAPVLAEGVPPRGLTPDGWVRTTGWLQVGHHPVKSAHLAAVTGLLWALVASVALMATDPVAAGVLVITTPVLCGAAWWLFTTRLRPASMARNVGTSRAEDLSPGDVVRLHGSIGPVAQVTAVTPGEVVRVDFHGGEHQTWAPHQVVHIAELLD